MFFNADTLTNKMPEFQFIINEHNPHIIGVNEVLPKNHTRNINPEEFIIEGYEMVAHPNVLNNTGRGTIIYVSNTLNYKQLQLFQGDEEFEEAVYIEVKLQNNDKLLCSCMYRRGETPADNNDKLMKNLRYISNLKYSHLLIMGDFNFKDIDWEDCAAKTNNMEDINFQFVECIRDCYFYQHINEPTRQRGTDTPSTLDLLFSNEEGMISDISLNAPLGKSDHSIICFNFICNKDNTPPKINKQYHKGDYKKFNDILSHIDWNDKFNGYENDVDKQWGIFKDIFLDAESKCVPRKVVHINGKLSKRLSMPMDKKKLRKIKRKNKLWGKIRKDMALEEEKLEYNRIRNQVRSLTRKSKKIIEKNIAKNSKSNPKAFWKYTQSKLKTRAGIPDLQLSEPENSLEPEYTKNDQEKADTFAKFFSSVFTTEPVTNPLPNFQKREYLYELTDLEITENTLIQKLKKIKTNKSPGPDQIHPRILHEVSNQIAKPLAVIFRTSLREQQLPNEWKHATVSAIYKKGARTHPLNYRPVSLTCIICKIFENIIRDHIIKHMKENNLFSPKQFGFIEGRSTTLQLLHVLDIWTEILDQGGTLDVVYCDFMKAFDKVPHQRLLLKLEKYGINGNILGWIRSFLSDRTQCVTINNATSITCPVTSGIPQGSVLGPILFVIYINDLPEVVDEDSFIFLFADDTKVFRQIRNNLDRDQLQKDISNLLSWSEKWLLKFHPDKCVSMTISNKRSTPPQNEYYMANNLLQGSECEKDIGVYIDNKLNFDKHINHIVTKANRVLAVTRKTFDYMDEEIFGSIFKGLVRPHLEYAAPVWNPKAIYQIDKIENVQRRATKLVPGLANLSYPERLKILKLPTLAYRRTRGDMIQVFKMINPNYGYDKSIPCLLTPNDNKYHKLRGHSKKLFPYSSNKDIRKFCFSNRIVHIWNSLPENVVSAENILSFEKNLGHHWRNQELLYDNHKAEIKLNTKTHPNEDGQSKSHNPMSEPAQCDLAALLQLETWKRNHKIP